MVSVAVLAGGPSHEHDVSLATARTLLAGLARLGHSTRVVYLSRGGEWSLGEPGASLDAVIAAAPAEPDDTAPVTSGVHPSANAVLDVLGERDEIAFLGLHGAFGEDGQVQRVLEAHGIPYTGAGPIASSMAMDKELMKMAASKLGVACARHDIVEADAEIDRRRLLAITGLPCVVKPVCGGSSVGITFVEDKRKLKAAVTRARAADTRGRALVEEFIAGTDVTCCVLRLDGVATALPIVSVEPEGNGVIDFHAKYEADSTTFTCPAVVDEAVAAHITDVSVALFEHLGLRGVAHVDFLIDAATHEAVFLEVNSLPGFTDASLVPRAAAAHGLSLDDVLAAILVDVQRPASGRRGGGATVRRSQGA